MENFLKYRIKSSVKTCALAMQYTVAAYRGARQSHLFREVEAYCMFIGYPRSGHTLIGSLLDAHPDMVIAQESDALRYVSAGFRRNQIYSLLLDNSSRFTAAGREWSGYSYTVPNQWHGRFARLRVIGDKKGGGTTVKLGTHPELLSQLRKTVGVPVKLIHVIRNPYDNISTIARRRQSPLRETISLYFSLCETVAALKTKTLETDMFEMRHEAFVMSPSEVLSGLCRFLGVEVTDDYLRDCSGIVFQTPRQTRAEAQWTPDLRKLVESGMKRFPFLQGYTYEE